MKQREWYRENINKIFEYFNTSERGLTESRVKENKKRFGENVLSESKKRSSLEIFISQFNNPLIYVLIVSDLIVFALGHYVDGFIILFVILLNAIIGLIQEGKAEDTLAALKKVIKTYATVLRNGKEERIPDYEVVVGDILVLKDGDPIAADARIFENNTLKINEAALTGESETVLKTENPISSTGVKVSDQKNMLFRGTYVTSGLGKAVVVNVGIKTVIGKISQKLVDLNMDVPLKKNIANLSKLIVYVIGVVVAILFVYGVYVAGYPVEEMFITAVAVAVAAIPESFPVIVTLVLATGVWRMSQKNVLVKRLQAVEALGQADVIALDKTGTITKNQMAVERLYIGGRYIDISGDGYEPKGIATEDGRKIDVTKDAGIDMLIKASVFTSVSEIEYSEEKKEWLLKYGDPTETALMVLGKKFGYEKDILEEKFQKILELPFELETKHHSTINKMDGKNILSVAGSPEVVLNHSTQIWKDGKAKKISKEDKAELEESIKHLSGEGYRILAVGIKNNPSLDIDSKNLPNLTFLGFIAIVDAIRPEVEKSVLAVRDAGMRAVMITGDHVETAKAIAARVGIYKESDIVISGKDMSDTSDDKLIEMLDRASVFARVTPKDKMRIIELYKKKGDTIAMTGDGVNDALSLVSADLGVSMGKIGTEVAREASDIVLLDDKFGNIIKAAEEGRNIYMTIRKSVLYLLSTNTGELLVIMTAIFIGLPLPLLASQIIWLNLVTGTFIVAVLTVDSKEEGLLNKSFKRPSKYLVDWFMGLRIILVGGVMTIATLVMFNQYFEVDFVKATTISMTLLAIFQWFNIFNVRSSKKSVFSKDIFNNKYLVISLVLTVILHLFAVYHPFMQNILKTTGLSLQEWMIMVAVGFSIIVVEEIRKFFYRMNFRQV